jgi:uncharacterized protein
MEEFIGYIGALCIGVSLGLIGGGGSILTVPVLVYLMGIDPVLATAYSLFIVGVTSLVGGVRAYKQGMVDLKTALVFGVPAILSVYFTRRVLLPYIPDPLGVFDELVVTKSLFLMVLFAAVMLLASVSMITKKCSFKTEGVEEGPRNFNYTAIVAEGLVVGVVTGLVGAGGGFLIIPALVLFSKLSMPKAVGTSLFIIAAKSLIGFSGDLSHMAIDWVFLLSFSSVSILGIFLGIQFSKRLSPCKLTHGFGWFVLMMGIYIVLKEFHLINM